MEPAARRNGVQATSIEFETCNKRRSVLETDWKPGQNRRRPGCTDACIRVTRKLVPVFVSQRHGAVVDGCKRPAHNAVSEYAFVRPGHVHIIALHPCKMQFAAVDTCWNRDRRIDVSTPDCTPENELTNRRVDKGEGNRGSDNGGQILSLLYAW